MVVRVIALLETLGFSQIGKVIGQRMEYELDARERTGDDKAVYVFLNPDGRVWKVGKTSRGFSRVEVCLTLRDKSGWYSVRSELWLRGWWCS